MRNLKLWIGLGVGVVCLTGYALLKPEGSSFLGLGGSSADSSQFELETAKRTAFRVTVTDRGTVNSQQNDTLVCTVEGTTTILEIVDEGTQVKAPLEAPADAEIVSIEEDDSLGSKSVTIVLKDSDGEETTHSHEMGELTRVLHSVGAQVLKGDILVGDVVCELDSASMVDAEKQQQIKVTQAEADLEKARKNVEIQKTQNESDIAKATLDRDLAQLELTKFKDGDFVRQRNEKAGAIKNLQQELAAAQDQLEFNERNAKKGYVQLSVLEQSRLQVMQKQIGLGVAETDLKVLEKYDYDRQIREFEANAIENVRELERTKLAGLAALSQFEADLKAAELTFEVEVDQLERLKRQIKGCTMVATGDGEVVYAITQSRRSEPVVIEEGATVRERQAIIQLPDLSQMKVEARIHESKINNVNIGNKCVIIVDAYADRPLQGYVDYVSSIASPDAWPNTDIKAYGVTVMIDDIDVLKGLDLRPGLTAGVEIITKESPEPLLQIPVQSVVGILDRFYTYKFTSSGPEMVEILAGGVNDQAIQVAEFSQVDTDGDSQISATEADLLMTMSTMKRVDTDEDGKISEDEFKVVCGISEGDQVIMDPRTHFAPELEKLENELLMEQEANQEVITVATEPAGSAGDSVQPADDSQQPPAEGPRGGGGGAGGDPAEAFKQWDKNGDGKVTKEEGPSFVSKLIERGDKDGDGALSLDEFNEMRKSFGGAGGGR